MQIYVVSINPNELPYDTLKHWPPMTYRDNKAPTQAAINDFAGFLEYRKLLEGTKRTAALDSILRWKMLFLLFPS